MLIYAVRRILWIVPVLFVASLVTFIVMHAAPGSPWNREGRQIPSEVIARLNERFGLDQPLPVQYLRWVAALLQGDFGQSVSTSPVSVSDQVAFAMWPSLQLGAMAFGLAIVVGVPLGMVSALRHGTVVDHAARAIAMLGMAAPAFLLGTLLQLWLGTPFYGEPASGFFFPGGGWGDPNTWILPTVALAGLPLAQVARFTRASMLDVLHADYVRTARSKGLDEQRIVWVHMLRNALVPLVTILGPLLALLITGSIVVERVFGIPGLGLLYLGAIRQRDYATMMAMTVIYASVVAVANIVVDLLYGVIDPRIRDGGRVR